MTCGDAAAIVPVPRQHTPGMPRLLVAARWSAALLAVAVAALQWSQAGAEARLQETVENSARATVTSVAGSGSEVVAVLLYGAYGLGSAWAPPGPLLALAALPCLGLAWVLRARG